MAFVSLAPCVASASSTASAVCERQSSMRGASLRRVSAPAPRAARAATRAPTMVYGKTMKESMKESCNFKQLLALAEHVGLDLDAVEGTLFAPDDNAFNRLKAGTLKAWYANPVVAKAILSHHFLPAQVLTLAEIKNSGFWESTTGGPLSYENILGNVKIGGANLVLESSNKECSNGIYHVIDSIRTPMGVKKAGIAQGWIPSIPSASFTETIVNSLYPAKPMKSLRTVEAAAYPSTVGGRKAMGLIKQLPFWMYGPPFNAATQEDYEPISIAAPSPGIGVDYQLMPRLFLLLLSRAFRCGRQLSLNSVGVESLALTFYLVLHVFSLSPMFPQLELLSSSLIPSTRAS